MTTKQPIYCCVPLEFIQPWDQEECLRQVAELRLGNMVLLGGTVHVGNSDADRADWKRRYPSLAAKIDATPRFPERPEQGMCALVDLPVQFRLDQVALCRELGLHTFYWPGSNELSPDMLARLRALGEGFIFSEMFMGESLSILANTLPVDRLKKIDATPVLMSVTGAMQTQGDDKAPAKASVFDSPESLDFQVVHDWFIKRFRDHGQLLRKTWPGPLTAIEASAQIRLAMEAGADIPIFELVPSEPLVGVAATRGAAKAYGKSIWGVHAAMGYYRAPTDLWTPERLRIAYDLFYAAGASFFSEPNISHRNWGSCSAFFSIPASPPIRWAEKECRGFDDPICVRGREVLAEHYRFTQFHDRPERGPRVTMGYLLGHLDCWAGHHTDRMWVVDQPGFLAADAVATWRHFDRAFDSEPWYIPPRKYYWQADPTKPLRHGTPPSGQVDLVPIEADAGVLRSYSTLVMLGWNTMTKKNYAKLRAFVEAGGTLFLSVPHLSTRTRTDRPQTFIHDGNVADLCGVRIAPGATGVHIEEVFLAHQTQSPRHTLAQGVLYLEETTLAKLELKGARVLAHPRGKPEQPVLLEHRIGKGIVYLLNTWDYPGERLDALITDILRALAEAEQGDIAVVGRDVFYSVYDAKMPSGRPYSIVYLVNHDIYGQPAYPKLMVQDAATPLRVDGREMRIAWVFDGLIIAPFDKFVKVTDARRDATGWSLTLDSAPVPGNPTSDQRLIQVQPTIGSAKQVRMNDQPAAIDHTIEREQVVRSPASPRTMRIDITTK